MTLEEFESYCDNLIKQEIRDKPKIGRNQDFQSKNTVWVNDTRIKLRKYFIEYSQYVEHTDSKTVEEVIDKKIKSFVNSYL